MRFLKIVTGSRLAEIVKIANTRSQIKIMQTEDLIVRSDGPAKLDIEIKYDWLLTCFSFVMKLPGTVLTTMEFVFCKNEGLVILYSVENDLGDSTH